MHERSALFPMWEGHIAGDHKLVVKGRGYFVSVSMTAFLFRMYHVGYHLFVYVDIFLSSLCLSTDFYIYSFHPLIGLS